MATKMLLSRLELLADSNKSGSSIGNSELSQASNLHPLCLMLNVVATMLVLETRE
jgi:hypothetical protein